MFFIPAKVTEWLISLKLAADKAAEATEEAVSLLREELANLRAQLATKNEIITSLRVQQATDRSNTDWLKARVNSLEFERAALLKKYQNVEIPVPTFSNRVQTPDVEPLGGFDDVGDKLAAQLKLGEAFADLGDAKIDNVDSGE